MDAAEVSRYITETCAGVDTETVSDNIFFFYNPDPNVPPDHMFPFVTLMTNDLNDEFSNLNRPSVFRLNIGLGKQTFHNLFGDPSRFSGGDGFRTASEYASRFDFTALDQLLPHPVYGTMCWVCILSPSNETFATTVQPLLAEAYDMTVSRHQRKGDSR